jgi:uncharacterized protein involved in outer membrane biogenesis
MNMKKIISLVVLGVVVVVAGAIIYISMNAGSMVKAGVETYGPQYTKTKVELGGVDASLFAGEISINNFLIGNPKGFKTSHAFKVDAVKITVDIRSLTGDTIHIKEIVIEAPDIIYELGGGGSNLQTIQNNVSKASGAGGTTAKAKADKSGGDEGPRVIIDNLYIRNAKVALSAGMLGGKKVPVPVPDIHLKDIGKDSKDGKGATMSEAVGKVMDEITGSVTKAASVIDLKGITKQAEELTKGAGGAAKGITEGLKGLFGK